MNAQVKLIRSDWPGQSTGRKAGNGGLSDREWQVMLAIAEGEAPAEMAARLGLSVKTVSTYRARILEKTGFRSNAQIAVAACNQGLVGNAELARLRIVTEAYRQRNAEHERLIGELHERFQNKAARDELLLWDEMADMVRDAHLAIHGPSD